MTLNNLYKNGLRLLLAGCMAASGYSQSAKSVASTVRSGQLLAAGFEKTVSLSTDEETLDLVQRIGQTLGANSGARMPIVTRVIESEEINVGVFPGGFVYVTTGIIGAATSESELAAAMAYGIARIVVYRGEPIPASMIGTTATAITARGAPPGISMSIVNHYRDEVREADRLGLRSLYQAGYDPEAAAGMLKKMEVRVEPATSMRASISLETYVPVVIPDSKTPKMFDPYPSIQDRIKQLEKWSAKDFAPRKQNVVTTPEFDKVHDRIAAKN